MQWDVLVISSDLEARRNLTRILEEQGTDLLCAPNIHGAIELLEREAGHSIGLIFCDRDLPDGNFRDFFEGSPFPQKQNTRGDNFAFG